MGTRLRTGCRHHHRLPPGGLARDLGPPGRLRRTLLHVRRGRGSGHAGPGRRPVLGQQRGLAPQHHGAAPGARRRGAARDRRRTAQPRCPARRPDVVALARRVERARDLAPRLAACARHTAALMISVVIPAHNEAGVIRRCLTTLLDGVEPGALDVVVACNGCSDDTAAIARSIDPTVRVVETDVASKKEHHGRALARLARDPRRWPALAVYATITAAGIVTGWWKARFGDLTTWERDSSSR